MIRQSEKEMGKANGNLKSLLKFVYFPTILRCNSHKVVLE